MHGSGKPASAGTPMVQAQASCLRTGVPDTVQVVVIKPKKVKYVAKSQRGVSAFELTECVAEPEPHTYIGRVFRRTGLDLT